MEGSHCGEAVEGNNTNKKDSSSILFSPITSCTVGLKGKQLQFPNYHTIIMSNLSTYHDTLFNSSELFMETNSVLS